MLITLIALMAVVLSGLIIIQTTVIRSAASIREREFNQSVINALILVSAQLDVEEQHLARENAMMERTLGSNNAIENLNPFPRNNMSGGTLSFGLSYSEQNSITIFGRDSQLEIQDTLNELNSEMNPMERRTFGLDGILEFREEIKRIREQWLVDDRSWYQRHKVFLEDRSIEERIDTTRLRQYLAKALFDKGIGLDFKYAIKNANLGNNVLVFGEHALS